MAVLSFLGIPITIREQVYENLLTFQPTSSRATAPSSSICTILTLNRQIHTELLHFLPSQLPILLQTNDPEFLKHILDEKTNKSIPLISQLHSLDNTISKDTHLAPIALKLDFYMYHSHLPSSSTPAFLIPSSSLRALLHILWLPKFYIWTMQASLSFDLVSTFSYSQTKAQDLLIQPFLNAFLPPTFTGILTNKSSIRLSADLAAQLKEKLTGSYDATGHLRKLQSLHHGAVSLGRRAPERFPMASKYAEIVWSCHRNCMRDAPSSLDCIHHLWLLTNDIAANHVQVLLNVAMGEPAANVPTGIIGSSDERFAQARQIGEGTIRFLRGCEPWGREVTGNDAQAQKAVRKRKARMSFRTHAACKGMGDVDAAVGFLREAMKYEPETSVKLVERIEELKAEGAEEDDKERKANVMKWEEEELQEN